MRGHSWRRLLVLASATAMLAPLASVPSASAAPPPGPYVLSLLDAGDASFLPSRDGNPINTAGQTAGTVGAFSHEQAAIYDTRAGRVHVLTGLGRLGAGCTSFAIDINELGHVVGYVSCEQGLQHVFLWTSPNKPVRWLNDDSDPDVRPLAMNDHDEVVGEDESKAFAWHADSGSFEKLGSFGGSGGGSVAYAVNNGGYITGQSETREGQYRPFLWLPRQKVLSRIGTQPSWSYAAGYGINDRGYIVGAYGDDYSGASHAFVWSPLTHRLQTLPSGEAASTASAISPGGVVTGTVAPMGLPQAAVWDTCQGAALQLPSPAGSLEVFPDGVNRYGQVTGFADTPHPTSGTGTTFAGVTWERPSQPRRTITLPCRYTGRPAS